MDRRRRARFSQRQSARLPAAARREGTGRHRGRRAVHPAQRRHARGSTSPKGLEDGPMPTHYEPLESPVQNALYPRQTNPGVNWFSRPDNKFSPPDDPRFPFVLTTYRLTEHHTTGGDEPVPAAPQRTAARAVRGNVARTGARNSACTTAISSSSPRCAARWKRARWSAGAPAR